MIGSWGIIGGLGAPGTVISLCSWDTDREDVHRTAALHGEAITALRSMLCLKIPLARNLENQTYVGKQ